MREGVLTFVMHGLLLLSGFCWYNNYNKHKHNKYKHNKHLNQMHN